jgi:hypothetical protein
MSQLFLPNEVSLSSLQIWPPSTVSYFSLPLRPSIELCSPKSSTPWSCSGSVKLTFPFQHSTASLPRPLPKPGRLSHPVITTRAHTYTLTHTHTCTHAHMHTQHTLNMVMRMHRDFMGTLSFIITLSWHAYTCTCTDVTMVIGVWRWVCWNNRCQGWACFLKCCGWGIIPEPSLPPPLLPSLIVYALVRQS